MKKKLLYCIFLFFMFSCTDKDINIENINNKVTVLGHGGMGIGSTYPMNTYESIMYCLNLGADGTEIDVQMTKDGVLVAFHDRHLDGKTTASGQIYKQNWAELKGTTYNNTPYQNYSLITLEQLFDNIDNLHQYIFFLDCKNFNPDTSAYYLNKFNDALINIIDRYNMVENVYVEFKRTDLIRSLKNKRDDIKIFIYSEFEKGLAIAKEFQLEGLVTSVDKITKQQVKILHENDFQLAVFNAHSKSRNWEALEKNADFIQTDKLKHLLRILN